MQQVLACGVSKSLPNELQWNLRMLLPRKGDLAPVPAPTNPQSQSSPAPYPGSTSANNNSSTTSTSNGQPVSQAPVAVMNSVAPMVTAPQVQGPPYGLQLSQPQGPQLSGLGSMGMNIAQARHCCHACMHAHPAQASALPRKRLSPACLPEEPSCYTFAWSMCRQAAHPEPADDKAPLCQPAR